MDNAHFIFIMNTTNISERRGCVGFVLHVYYFFNLDPHQHGLRPQNDYHIYRPLLFYSHYFF